MKKEETEVIHLAEVMVQTFLTRVHMHTKEKWALEEMEDTQEMAGMLLFTFRMPELITQMLYQLTTERASQDLEEMVFLEVKMEEVEIEVKFQPSYSLD